MKRNVFAIFLAVMLVAALLFVVAPSTKAADPNLIVVKADNESVEISENGKTLDLNGKQNVSVNIAENIELAIIDSANMEKDGANAGTLTITGAGTFKKVALYGDYRYLAVEKDGKYSFHPFNMAISKRGINVVSKTVSLEAMFVANDVVREMITDFGIYKLDGATTGCISAKPKFDAFAEGKNGATACYDLTGSLAANMLNETRNYCAYIKIGDELIQGNQKVDVTPINVLKGVNNAYAAGKYTGETKKLAIKLFNENADLQQHLQAMTIFAPGGNWDISDQHDGVITLPQKGTSLTSIATVGSNYRDASFTVKELTPSKNEDGSLKKGNFSAQIAFLFANGKCFEVRIHNTDGDGNYKIQTMAGINKIGTDSGWKWLSDLTSAQITKLMSDGVQFRVALVDHYAVMLVDGVQMATYDLAAEYANAGINANEAAQVRFTMQGNNNTANHEIAYTLGEEPAYAKVQVADGITNGTVKTDKIIRYYDSGRKERTNQAVVLAGQKVTLTSTPNSNYAQKLYINGAPLLLDYNTGKYSIVAEAGKTYEITGSFVKVAWYWTGGSNYPTEAFNLINQGHGIAHALAHPSGKEKTGSLVHAKEIYDGASVLVKDPSHGTKTDYAIVIHAQFEDVGTASIRLVGSNGKYKLQSMNDVFFGWSTHYNLTDAENEAVKNGDGVWYSLIRQGAKLYLLINNKVVKEIDLSSKGVASDTVLQEVKIQAYNFGYAVDIPYMFLKNEDVTGTVTIPTLANGTVTAYKKGNVVLLEVAPASGYSQKLYINGEPLMLPWKYNAYTFVAEEGKTYEITGSFETALNIEPRDTGRWDLANQAHGILNTYYPANDDSWWVRIKGDYDSFAAVAKNSSDKLGVATAIQIKVNGVEYSFRIIKENNKNGVAEYKYQRFGIGNSDWTTKQLGEAEKAAFIGDGVDFKLERTGANTLTISINGVVYDTYTMSGATADHNVEWVAMAQYGNKGEYVEIPFEVK